MGIGGATLARGVFRRPDKLGTLVQIHKNVIDIMKQLNLKIKHKKHAPIYDNDEKFSCLYNYIFEKQ